MKHTSSVWFADWLCFSPQELRSPERPNLQPTNPPSAKAVRPLLRTAAEPLSVSSCEDQRDSPKQIILSEFDEYKFVDWALERRSTPLWFYSIGPSGAQGTRNIHTKHKTPLREKYLFILHPNDKSHEESFTSTRESPSNRNLNTDMSF